MKNVIGVRKLNIDDEILKIEVDFLKDGIAGYEYAYCIVDIDEDSDEVKEIINEQIMNTDSFENGYLEVDWVIVDRMA